MSDQPEALFLADVIENDPQSKAHHDAAAAELRRLHALAMDQQGEIYGLTFARETERKIHNLVKAENDALRARLAEPKAEPMAYPEGDVVGPCVCGSWPGGKCLKCPRIAPPTRRPLTDEEIDALETDKDGLPNSHLEFARAIERKITGGNDE